MGHDGPLVVTGANGFIGRQVVAALAAAGRDVIAVSRTAPQPAPRVEALRVKTYLAAPFPKDAVLIHLAGAQGEVSDEVELVKALTGRAHGRLVFASSALVYGDHRARPWREDDGATANGDYARGKLACEAVVLSAGGSVARLANVYGPGMADTTVLSDILRQIPGEGPLALRNGAPIRDYLSVVDAAAGLIALARQTVAGVVNIGTGRGTSVGGLAHLALAMARQGARPVSSEPAEPHRRSHCVLDITKAATDLRWRPRVDLAAGILATMEGRPWRSA